MLSNETDNKSVTSISHPSAQADDDNGVRKCHDDGSDGLATARIGSQISVSTRGIMSLETRVILSSESMFRYRKSFLGCHITFRLHIPGMGHGNNGPVCGNGNAVELFLCQSCDRYTNLRGSRRRGDLSYLIKDWCWATENEPSTTCMMPPKMTATQKNPGGHSISQAKNPCDKQACAHALGLWGLLGKANRIQKRPSCAHFAQN